MTDPRVSVQTNALGFVRVRAELRRLGDAADNTTTAAAAVPARAEPKSLVACAIDCTPIDVVASCAVILFDTLVVRLAITHSSTPLLGAETLGRALVTWVACVGG